MSEQTETTPKEINNYEEYISVFFPQLKKQIKVGVSATPEEIGAKMAQETLTHIQNLLAEDKAS